jgi:hypothetical protein
MDGQMAAIAGDTDLGMPSCRRTSIHDHPTALFALPTESRHLVFEPAKLVVTESHGRVGSDPKSRSDTAQYRVCRHPSS